eukprot:8000944-Alexandrium_andersonii.AAC.1
MRPRSGYKSDAPLAHPLGGPPVQRVMVVPYAHPPFRSGGGGRLIRERPSTGGRAPVPPKGWE